MDVHHTQNTHTLSLSLSRARAFSTAPRDPLIRYRSSITLPSLISRRTRPICLSSHLPAPPLHRRATTPTQPTTLDENGGDCRTERSVARQSHDVGNVVGTILLFGEGGYQKKTQGPRALWDVSVKV